MPNRTKAKRRTTNASAATAVAATVRVIQRRAGVDAAEPRQRRTASSPPQGKRRMPGTATGLDALVFRRELLTVYEAAVVVHDVVEQLKRRVADGTVSKPKSSGAAHFDGWHFGITRPQRGLMQAVPGFNGAHTGVRVFGSSEAMIHDRLHKLLRERYDLEELNTLYDKACPHIPRLWPDLPFNGFDLIGFGTLFFPSSQGKHPAPQRARRDDGTHKDNKDVRGIPAAVFMLEVEEVSAPFRIYPVTYDVGVNDVLAARRACVEVEVRAPRARELCLRAAADAPRESSPSPAALCSSTAGACTAARVLRASWHACSWPMRRRRRFPW